VTPSAGTSSAGPATVGTVAVVGAAPLVEGYALAGARVTVAETPGAVRRAVRELPDDVLLVVLTADAGEAVADLPAEAGPLRVVMPR
jgi:vacuolar-type H+-ATPase subunit F/Vma7